jgi:hypothetical protein
MISGRKGENGFTRSRKRRPDMLAVFVLRGRKWKEKMEGKEIVRKESAVRWCARGFYYFGGGQLFRGRG